MIALVCFAHAWRVLMSAEGHISKSISLLVILLIIYVSLCNREELKKHLVKRMPYVILIGRDPIIKKQNSIMAMNKLTHRIINLGRMPYRDCASIVGNNGKLCILSKPIDCLIVV